MRHPFLGFGGCQRIAISCCSGVGGGLLAPRVDFASHGNYSLTHGLADHFTCRQHDDKKAQLCGNWQETCWLDLGHVPFHNSTASESVRMLCSHGHHLTTGLQYKLTSAEFTIHEAVYNPRGRALQVAVLAQWGEILPIGLFNCVAKFRHLFSHRNASCY